MKLLWLNWSSVIVYCRTSKPPYQQMQQAAAADGIELALVSSYRSFAQQARTGQRKYTGQRPVYNKAQQQVDISQFRWFCQN